VSYSRKKMPREVETTLRTIKTGKQKGGAFIKLNSLIKARD